MNIINLTPHKVVVKNVEGDFIEFEPFGKVVRLDVKQEKIGELVGMEIFEERLGELAGIDESDLEDVDAVIVSRLVAEEFKKKFKDIIVFIPNTAKAVRDESGKIIAVEGLIEVF